MSLQNQQQASSPLAAPRVNPEFARALDELVSLARQGQPPDSLFFNPSDEWLVSQMPILQDLPQEDRDQVLAEAGRIKEEAAAANAAGRAATRAWPGVVVRLDSGGLAFFSQLGVVRRPDLTQYFIDGFVKNRDALAFSEENQALFAEVFSHVNNYMRQRFPCRQTRQPHGRRPRWCRRSQ